MAGQQVGGQGTVIERMGKFGLQKIMYFVLAVLVLGGTPVLARADAVTVKATQSVAGYGRLTFRWPQPVGYTAKRTGNVLVIAFARPIKADLRPVMRGLPSYISSIEPAPNEATLVFRLKGNFAVRSYDSGSSVVVDIVGTPPPSVQATSNGALSRSPQGQLANVKVRTGTHPKYSRIVFDWPTTPSFTLARSGNKTTVSFGKPGQVKLGLFAGGRVRNVAGATSSLVNGKLDVTFQVAANSQVKAFVSGKKLVMDVYAPGSLKTPPPTTTVTAKTTARQNTPVQQTKNTPPKKATPKAIPNTPPPGTAPKPLALTPQTSPASAQTGPAAQGNASPAQSKTLKGLVRQTKVKTETLADGAVSLRFNWDEPVGAAVFRRGQALWVVFDKKTKVDTAALARGGGGLVLSVEQVASNVGTSIRMTTVSGVNPTIKRSGLAWILEFSNQAISPSVPLTADAQPDSPLGARIFIPVPEPGNVVAFRDPEIGDNLIVIPVIPLGHGVSRTWKYPQFKLLPTEQGVVVKPMADNLRIRPIRQGVEISSTGTLQVSKVTAEEKANIDLASTLASGAGMQNAGPLTRVLNLEKWKRGDLQSFNEIRQKLQLKIAKSRSPQSKEQARNALLELYFANGFEAEALGVLEAMRVSRPTIENEPRFRLLRGASSWLMQRYADARKDLYHASLDGNDEGMFWRALVVAGEGDLANAAYELRKVGAITRPYPKAIKMPTATLVAAAAVELGDVKQAKQYIEVLSVDDPSRAQKDQIDFVAGKLEELSGNVDGAIAKWEGVMDGVHRFSRARAAVARTELLLKLGLFTPKDAIEEFEKLRYVWRGDEFEFQLLRRLGGLYLDELKYRKGLTALRQAATYFPKNKAVNEITNKMSKAFTYLYMENGADVLPPVTAIALYDEFRELTPAGAAGDEMIRRLADRLVGIDLLDRAAYLLESQVDFRLVGEQRAQVGARLALIYLFDRKYQNTLDALDKSEVKKMSDALRLNRLLLRAQAYIGLDQPDVALKLIKAETSLAAEQIRGGIYWRQKNWKNSSKSMLKIVRALGAKARKPLNDAQALSVMGLAVAYTLDGNEAGVSLVISNYKAAMMQTTYADAFTLITDTPDKGLLNFRRLDQIVKEVDNFQGFMTVYRQRVASGQLSSIY